VAKERYKILFDVEIDQHLDAIELKYHSLIRSAIERQLRFEASKETRNRKPLLRENELEADWEIRFGPDNRFRVLYTVDEEHHEVVVLAIGVKQGNRLFVAGEELTI
jgi:mRNA-degrading endonuclease RelE of RelBE toxin-antitoxin system